ncbi:MAG: signal peptidase I [Gammaproteobacteria bacterium]|nr:signal peptidase I [Gammaproteobacteria bacterium]
MFHFDFEFLLLILTAVTGLLWLADVLVFARLRQPTATSKIKKEPLVIEYSRAFFPVLIAVLVLRAFLFEPFRIPSGSMMPTLLVGDFILVNKFTYGLRLPVWQTRITDGNKPKRGDVVVFRYPKDESQDYIKRVVGLPGDHVAIYNQRLSINGKLLDIEPDRVYEGLGDLNKMQYAHGCDRAAANCQVYIEKLDQAEYTIMNNPGSTFGVNGEVFIPEGEYFVMGDNRNHSNDSRIWGNVPEENLVGKAVMIWMHWDWRKDGTGLNISRVGDKISN